MHYARIASVVVALAAAAAPVRAEDRPVRATILAGGYAAIPGPASYGGAAVVSVSPGGSFDRFGLRLSARSFEKETRGFAAAGITFEAAAARPSLVMSLFGEAGIASGGAAVVGAGYQAILGVIGPAALAFDGGVHLFIDEDIVPDVAFSGALLLGLSF